MSKISTKESFMKKVVVLPNGCWQWQGKPHPDGYGNFTIYYRLYPAHRAAYLLFVGPIPDDYDIHHKCKNRLCVNPDHLLAIGRKEHLYLDDTVAAANKAKTHCMRGHPLDESNTYVQKDGHRCCRTCERERSLRFYHANRNRINAKRSKRPHGDT